MIPHAATGADGILEVDLGNAVANWRFLAARVAPARCAAVVKADGYGLGAVEIAGALARAGCGLFFVASLDEGMALRRALPPGTDPSLEIAVLNGPASGEEGTFADHALIPVLNEPGQVARWTEIAAAQGGLPAMLQVDTGMARLGLGTAELDACADRLSPQGPIRWRGLLSHLACADDPSHALNEQQRARFDSIARRFPFMPASLAASAGIFLGAGYHYDLVRPGAAIYGVNPQPGRSSPLQPVVVLRGRILQTREVAAGQPIGYGASHVMPTAGRLATVAIGYADGWLRAAGGKGVGRIAGHSVKQVGRISMDLTIFDVSGIPAEDAAAGAYIDFLDRAYGVDDAAAAAGTIGYEILTSLGRRYVRHYRGVA